MAHLQRQSNRRAYSVNFARRRQAAGTLTPDNYVIKTLVTSDMICRVAEKFGCRYYGDVLTGFKWIGSVIDEAGPEKFVFGFEEAHGYLAGTYARDKDGAVAGATDGGNGGRVQGRRPHAARASRQGLPAYGCHQEKTINITLPGTSGVAQMKAIMERSAHRRRRSLGGLTVAQVRDYLKQQVLKSGSWSSLAAKVPPSDLLIFDLDPAGNRAPSAPPARSPRLSSTCSLLNRLRSRKIWRPRKGD